VIRTAASNGPGKPRAALVQGLFWTGIYLALVVAPLIVLLAGTPPASRGFWRELSAALGYAGMAMLGVQFALTARFRRAAAPFGVDMLYYFHRTVSLMAVVIIAAHVGILFSIDPRTLALLNILHAPWRARAAVVAFTGLFVLLTASLFRRQIGISYEGWRRWHGTLAIAAVVLALVHIELVSHYIETPWKRILWTGYSIFWTGLLIHVRILRPWSQLRRPYVVESVLPERGSAWTVTIRPEGHQGVTFQPGQFAWLTAWNSPFAVEEHPFSFSSSGKQNGRFAFTIKELGDFTRRVRNMVPGQRVFLDGPYGAFSIDRHFAPGYVFIAGGVGITPMMSMLRTLADRGDRSPLHLFYANKLWEEVTFREEIEALQTRLRLTVIHALEAPPAGWTGETGFVTRQVLDRWLPAERRSLEYFVCGPDPMREAVEKALYRLGVPLTHVHAEKFNLV
jgi:predicted ferric reductase